MITTIDIRDDLWKKAKDLATERWLATGEKADLKTIVNDALEAYLKHGKGGGKTK